MSYSQGKYPIIRKIAIAKQTYDFTILCPEIAKEAKMGQFINIYPEGCSLRRPISICGIDPVNGTIRLVFEIRGDGTDKIAKLNEGELIDILAPLGKGWTIPKDCERIVVIGGGIGNPPILPIAEKYKEKVTVISGFRNSSAVILQDDFQKTGAEVILCTDDGSTGRKGFVTDALVETISKQKIDIIMACGPTPMLSAIAKIAKENSISCQVSLEERMGCGIGACLVCSCKTMRNGEEHFAHVCKDGPVMNAEEVVWND